MRNDSTTLIGYGVVTTLAGLWLVYEGIRERRRETELGTATPEAVESDNNSSA